MKYDRYGLLVSEILPESDTGNLEDSCANTCRKALMETNSYELNSIRNGFRDYKYNYIRHPNSNLPISDMSWDQALPLLMVFDKYQMDISCREFLWQLQDKGYRLNGYNYPSLLFLTVYKRIMGSISSLWDIPLLLQALVMRYVPWRWSDATMRFESSKGSTCDYVNYFHILQMANENDTFVTRLCWKITPKDFLLRQIKDYYASEPNVQWLLDLYEKTMNSLK